MQRLRKGPLGGRDQHLFPNETACNHYGIHSGHAITRYRPKISFPFATYPLI
jgi:hypothetical protein